MPAWGMDRFWHPIGRWGEVWFPGGCEYRQRGTGNELVLLAISWGLCGWTGRGQNCISEKPAMVSNVENLLQLEGANMKGR